MNYKVIDSFIDKNFCNNLIEDGIKVTAKYTNTKIHKNRVLTACTSLEFHELYDCSKYWKQLINKITSQDFFNECSKKLNIENSQFKLNSFFFKKKLYKQDIRAKKIAKSNLQVLPTFTLVKYLMYRIYKILFFKAFQILNKLKNNKTVELLFDYSQAGNGYGREIHRDSDERLIVFLLYLNELDSNASGGNLEIFKYDKNYDNSLNPQPKQSDCTLINKIDPAAGKLVIFRNDDLSFHAVSEMKNSSTTRHFLYGGFTITSGKNPYIKSKKKMKTNFYLYL
jgi:Rps23 Pro-64 3,4-dihydroxylase Tpa1-like proline 4-hydroxylase